MTNVEEFLREGDSVKWGEFEARVIHTPGHTPGSLCLYLPSHKVALSSSGDSQAASHASSHAKDHGETEPRLIAGDTLFAGSIGRTDLWGGSLTEIMKSLRTKVLALPDETFVLPGHGPATTIGAERESTPFLRPG
jgi:glyoxylase-like metal-dependent hydrolase (beta-lactamase superfamily II)